MKVNLQIHEFDKEVLSFLFETAEYGNTSRFEYDFPKWAIENAEGKYYCDMAADALLKGGSIYIYDNSCIEDDYSRDDDMEYYGQKGVNWVRTFKHQVEYNGWDGKQHVCYVPAYEITLETLINGINASTDDYKFNVIKTLIGDLGDCDMEDAYNVFQLAVFGEIVYG